MTSLYQGTQVNARTAISNTRALRQRLTLTLKAALRDTSDCRGTPDLITVIKQEQLLLQAALDTLCSAGAPVPATEAQRADSAWLRSLEYAVARADAPPRVRNKSIVPRVVVEDLKVTAKNLAVLETPAPATDLPAPEAAMAATAAPAAPEPVPVTAYERSRARRGLPW